MDVKSLHVQSVACPRMRTLVLQTMDFQSIVVDYWWHREVLAEFSDEEIHILLEWHKMRVRASLPDEEDEYLILPEIKLPL